MRFLVRLTLVLMLLPSIAEAKDMYLPITGSVGVFRTDARIFNPSGTKDISVTATFIPAAGNPASPSTVTLTIPRRQMLVRNDVVQSVFASSGLGAIKLSSPDDFQATARIYADTPAGTLGQFSPAVDSTGAKLKGVVIQLKSNGTTGQTGTFRTNLGFLNVGAAQANVTLRLYDKNNALITPPTTITVSAGGVLPPGNYFNVAGDFTDAWVSYESSQPLIAYGSVVDNGTTDPTFIPAFEDTGSNPQEPPPPSTKTFNITAEDGSFSSDKALVVQEGDRVILRITSMDVTHGFALENYAPVGVTIPSGTTRTIEFVADRSGRFFYFCTVTGCSPGHSSMIGTFVVEGGNDGGGGPGY